jgi:phosphatidylglycerol:prolipoprotein diacylglycerol transferase
MYPVLFEIGGFEVTSFGVMIFLSFLTGAWILSLQLARRGMDPEIAWEVLAVTAIAGVLGAKLYYMGLHWRDFAADPVGEITSRAGLVWYGGLIGGALAFYWQAQRRRLPVATMFDSVAPGMGLAYAVGRVGCFLVGDDYGLPTDASVGIAFPQGSPPSTAGYFRSLGVDIDPALPDGAVLAVHPTQLYEVAGGVIMFAILWQLSKRALRAGQLFGAFLVLYGIERFAVEFVRAKGDRFVFGLTTSQIASMVAFGVGLWLWTRRPGRPTTAAVAPEAVATAR